MGGKPFQSKGCINCRQRKVRCDTERPECRNCQRRGVKCQGYEKQLIFVYQNGSNQAHGENRVRDNRPRKTQVAIRPPMPMNTSSVNRQQIISSLINVYFPDNIRGSIDLDPLYKLITGVTLLPSKSIMLEKAMAATCCIYFGKVNNDNRMLGQGLQLYNGAIHHVSNQLSRNVYTDELFFTIGFFQILVTLYCPQGIDVWIHQTAVTNGIFQKCFNHRSESPLIKTLCLAFQRMRLLKALSPMEAKNAMDLAVEHTPASLDSNENQAVDELFHLMAGIAPISAAVDMTDKSDHDACQLLLLDCIAHRERMMSWYSRECERIGGCPSVGRASDFPSKTISPSEHLFGYPYRFNSLDNARIHICLWTALSILQAVIGQAHTYAFASPTVDLTNNKEKQLSEFWADEVSRAIPYCLQDSMKAWGGSVTIFGMGQMAKVYTEVGYEEKFMWTLQLFKHIDIMGSDLARHMHQLLQYGWVLYQQANQEALVTSVTSSPTSASSPASHISPTTPPSPASTVSSVSTAPFVAEYAEMPKSTDIPMRSK